MTPAEIIRDLRNVGGATHYDVQTLRNLTIALAQRVLELEAREEVRHRIEPIMRGEKPEKGLGSK